MQVACSGCNFLSLDLQVVTLNFVLYIKMEHVQSLFFSDQQTMHPFQVHLDQC